MNYILETERLILRAMTPDDAEAAFKWCGDPTVNKYMIYPVYQSVEQVRAWLEKKNPDDPDDYDNGIVLKSTGELIGSGGLVWKESDNAWSIGYNLRADQWGHGYAVEMLKATIDFIRKTRPVNAIEGTFAAENLKSRRVMEKMGMHFYENTEYTKLDGSVTFKAITFRRDFDGEGAPFTLRDWREGDAAAKSAFTNDPEVLRWLWDGVPTPYTAEDAQAWLGRVAAMKPEDGKEFAICNEQDVPIGTIGYTVGASMRRCCAEIGYFLGRESWNRGIGTRALRQVTDYIWQHHAGVQRIYAEVYAGNKASGRVLTKAGFTLEGVQKKAVVKDGRIIDLEIYALLRN